MRETGRAFGEGEVGGSLLLEMFLVFLVEKLKAFAGECEFVHYFIVKGLIIKQLEDKELTYSEKQSKI